MDDSRVFGTAAGMFFALGLGVGMTFMSCEDNSVIEQQKQYCISLCEKFAKDKSDFIECCHGCKEAAEVKK